MRIRRHLLVIVFAALSFLLPLIWLRGGYLYTGEENYFVNYQLVVEKNLFSWSDRFNYGSPTTPNLHAPIIPNGIFYKGLETLGIQNDVIQIMYMQVSIFALLVASSYFLSLFTKKDYIKILGSLFYVFNFYFISALWYSAKMYQLILMPLIFVWLYRYLKTGSYKYVAFNFVAWFLLQGIFSNLPQLIATLFIYVVAFGFYLYCGEGKLPTKVNLKKSVLFFAPLLFLGMYHGVVYYYSFVQEFAQHKAAHTFSSLKSPLHLVYQLRGSWWENASYEGITYNHWYGFFSSKVMVVTSFVLLLIIILPIIKTQEKKYLYMLGFFVGSILLASGVSFYPQAYQWIYDNVPFLYIYREPWSKFLPYVIFSMAGLVTFSLDKIKNKLHLFIIAFVIIFRMYPFLSPSLFDYTNLGWKKLFLKPPQAWQQFDDWSLNYKDSYILPFPISTPTTQIIYRWYDGQLGNSNLPLYLHFGSTNTFSTAYAPNSYVKQILYSFFEIESMNFIKLMTVDYMLEQRDAVDFDRLDNFTYQPGARKFFEKKPFKVFDESLHLYKILPEYKLELIYVPNSISVISADISNLPDYVTDSFVVGDALYLKEQNENILDIKYKKPLVSYEKVNPTKYAVDINGAKGTFPIVFNQAYNRYWSLDGIESAHLIANGYANSWFIDTKEYCSKPSNCIVNEDGSYDFDLTLSYYPQKVYNVLFVIIFGLFLSNSGYLFVRLFVRKSKQ